LLRFVAIPLAVLRPLELRHRWLMQVFVSFAGPGGRCWPSLALLAEEAGEHLSWVRRNVQEALERGYITRKPRRGGGYTYTIAERFLPVRGKPVLVPTVNAGVPTVGTEEHLEEHLEEPSERAPATSSDRQTKLPSLSEDEIPSGWEEAAAAERRLAGLGEVNLRAEWRKLVAYSEGARITIWRWRGWALKARGDVPLTAHLDTLPHGGATPANGTLTRHLTDALPGDDREQRQARDWVRRGFWLRDGSWGPAPDQPGCTLPPALVAWCLRERAAAA
jgi:hypothetical protein